MKIYKSEIADGLEGSLKNNTIACLAVAEKASNSLSFPELTADTEEQLKKLGVSKAENKDQFDLYYLQSILVSTGWNKNDDVFDPQELWAARNTPEDKPFNFMHDEKDIIGHITANDVVDFEGSVVTEDSEVPSTFNILTSAVIYTEWSDPEQRDRMQKIVAEIENGKWFVSMECLFPDFDYALANDEGDMRVVPRDEASAFLTKYLRSYGGNGKYENYRVGRLLRNLSFSGKGLVSKPANPRSIILEGNDLFDESQAQILTISSPKENDMSENLDKQIDDLRAELAEAKVANEALKDKVVAEQHTELSEKIQSLEVTVAEQAEKLAEQTSANETLAESLKSQEEALANKDEEMKEKMDELRDMKKKEAMMKRRAELEEAGLDTEEASATLEEFSSVDDDTFAKVIALMKRRSTKKEEDKEADAGNCACKAEEEVSELDEEQDSAEASEEVLENVEEATEVAIAEAMGEEDPAENLRAVASEWLGSILKNKPQQ
jgi:hypothetical protein